MAFKVQDLLWSPFRSLILSIPPSRLPFFPIITGSTWFVTLSALLLTWLGRGMPQYPGQSNPDVAFISDIASFELKPLFLVGTTLTATGFMVTISAVHVVRHESGFKADQPPSYDPVTDEMDQCRHGTDSAEIDESLIGEISGEEEGEEEEGMAITLRLISLVSIFAAIIAGSALILLAVMDTVNYYEAHNLLLRICFAGLVVQSTGTVIVYAREVLGLYIHLRRVERRSDWGPQSLKAGICATLSILTILVEVCLGVVFIALLAPKKEQFRHAAILEWVIAFVGAIYVWLFGGFFNRYSAHILLK